MYDSFYQYTGFLLNYKNLSFYSLKSGLGFNFYATACYYLFSPINILLLFCNIFNIDIIFTIIILIKIGLASLTMSILLNSYEKNKSSILFGVIYSLSGFIITYYYNIMWLDSIYLLPLVILGLNYLIKKNKPLLYLITLSITIISNFYTGYMVCIFALIYFIITIINTNNINKKQVIKQFIIYSILAGLISSVVLLPAFYGLMMGKASGYARHDFTNYYGINKQNILMFFHRLSPGSYFNGEQSNGPMMIYSSLFATTLFVLSFFNKKFDLKYKISLGIMLSIFLLSFSFNIFDYAWQFFQRPVWWNSRYSFIFSFMIIHYAYLNYIKRDNIKLNKITYSLLTFFTIMLFFVSYLQKYITTVSISNKIIIIIFGTITLLFIFSYYTYQNNKQFKYYILVIVILELLINTYMAITANVSNRSIKSLKIYNTNTQNVIDMIPNKDDYRAELINRHVFNDGLIYDYNGINYFNSVRNQNYVSFCEDYLKFTVNSHCSTLINYFDPILLNLFNIKYLIGTEQNYYQPVQKYYNTYIYETPFNSSYGYLVEKELKELKLDKKDSKYQNLTKLLNTMINTDTEYYQEFNYNDYKITFENGKFKNNRVTAIDKTKLVIAHITFTNKEKKVLISNNSNSLNSNINIKINDKSYQPNGNYYLINEGDNVDITINLNPNQKQLNDFKFYTMDLDSLYRDINNLDDGRLIMDKKDHHLLNGHITVNDRNILFLSLPYEDGFIIKVDGKKVNYYKILDAFVAIDLEKGDHNITIDYVSKGFNTGLLLSILAISASTILLITNKCYNKSE